MNLLPMAETCPNGIDKSKLLKEIKRRQLAGLCNNTKWNQIFCTFRSNQWTVCNRSKWINGHISDWENDWNYRLPYPFVGVEWLDINFQKYTFKTENGGRHEIVTNLKADILTFIKSVGVEYEANEGFVRIFGYAPKCYNGFFEDNT